MTGLGGGHLLVEDYLRRVEAATAGLPASERAAIVAETRDLVDHLLGEAGADDELAVRSALAELGPPEEIAGAAAELGPAPEFYPGHRGRFERVALVVLVVGGLLIPIIGWLVGFGLVRLSDAWSTAEKLIGLVVPVVLVWLATAGVAAVETGFSLSHAEWFILLIGPVSGPSAAAYLSWRLRVRTPAQGRSAARRAPPRRGGPPRRSPRA